jgi:crotonobetainyl-CoA:carnitine CoA-transferase CaiB-like acyl-CoA transferase
MLDSMISAMTSNFMIYLGDGDVPDPRGSAYSSIVPYRAFATKGDDIVIAVGSEKLWRVFGPAIGHPELVDHPSYATNSLRVKNRDQLEPFLAEIFRADTLQNWLTRLRAAGVPASPIRRFDEVVNDAQCAVRNIFPYMADVGDGRVRVVSTPIKSSAEPPVLSNAPALGQHTHQILSEWLGIGEAELRSLRSAGVIVS